MAFSPVSFLSNINAKEGLAKPCKYEVVIPLPTYINSFIGQSLFEQILNLPNTIIADVTAFLRGSDGTVNANPTVSRYLALQCENAELPGKTLITQESKIYGPTFKVPYQTQYAEIPLTFICTNDFYERKLFERWIEAIMPTDTNNLRFSKDNNTRYMTNIKVVQYDEFIKQIFAIELIDAFPVSIASQQLSWADGGYHRLTVQFTYQRYKTIYEGQYDLAAAALEILGSRASGVFDRTMRDITSPAGRLFANIL